MKSLEFQSIVVVEKLLKKCQKINRQQQRNRLKGLIPTYHNSSMLVACQTFLNTMKVLAS